MDKFIAILQWILKQVTTISEWTFKVPVWALKLIPGMKDTLEKLEGYKTVIFNASIVLVAFLEKYDWTEIGSSFCSIVNMILGCIKVHFECDPSWLSTIAGILIALANIALRKTTKGELPKVLK